MKILLVVPSLRLGGAEKVMVSLANTFVGLRMDTVMCTLAEGRLQQNLQDNVRLINLNTYKVTKSMGALKGVLDREKPDLVICTQLHLIFLVVLLRLLTGGRYRVFAREATTLSEAFGFQGWKKQVFQRAVQFVYSRADRVVCNSHKMLEDFQQHFGVANTVVINNSIFGEQHARYLQKQPPVDGKQFVFCGRLAPEKNVDQIIQSFQQAVEQTGASDSTLTIIGEGQEKEKLMQLVDHLHLQDKVVFTGYLSDPLETVSERSIFVLASSYEGMPSSLVQAMMCGLKVIASRCCEAVYALLENGKYGLTFEPGNGQQLTEAMQWVLTQPQVPMVDSAVRRKIFDEHAENYIAQQYLREYESIKPKWPTPA